MAAGSAFTLAPNLVIEEEPEYNNVITASESMKKEYYNLSSTPVEKYKLTFSALTTANKDVIIDHYKDQNGIYHSFSWTSVPSYIGGGSNITVRYTSLSIAQIGYSKWKITLTFEKDN